jgi:hypothetical protein
MTIAECSSGMSIADADKVAQVNNSKAMQIARMGFSPQGINDGKRLLQSAPAFHRCRSRSPHGSKVQP